MNTRVVSVENPPIPDFKAKAASLSSKALTTYDMTQAVPSFPTFERIRIALAEDLKNPELSFYTDVPGLSELRQAIVERHPLKKALGLNNLIVTSGANHAAYTALTLLLDIGDKVLLPEPFYFNHDMAIKMLGLNAHYFQFDAKNSFQLRAETLIEELKRVPCKAVLLVSPNNPTGAFYASSEILKLLEWTSKNEIQVIIDETYIDYDPKHLNNENIANYIGKNLSLVGSFSKSYSLTGYRVGYFISGKNEVLQSLKIQDTMLICAPTLGQRAALHGIQLCQSELNAKVTELAELANLLRQKSAEWKNFRLQSTGAFFAYIQHPYTELNATQAALKLYEEAGILSLPGTVFGTSQNAFLRLAFANFNRTKLLAALDQLTLVDQKLLT